MSLRAGTRFRARKIDLSKPIPLHWNDSHDYDADEDAGGAPAPSVCSSMLEDDDQDLESEREGERTSRSSARGRSQQQGTESQNQSQGQGKSQELARWIAMAGIDQAEIPVPRWRTVQTHPLPGLFRRPSSYLRTKLGNVEMDEFDSAVVEYDLESDDERFLVDMKKRGVKIKEDVLERCIDHLERETARLRQIKDNNEVLAPPGIVALANGEGSHLRPVALQHIYDHWVAKRQRRGKALLRQFEDPPEMHDPNPKVAFRPRHKNFSRSRRRNDASSFIKLRDMRSGLERLQMILELVKRRERLKDEVVNHTHAFRFEQLQELLARVEYKQAHPHSPPPSPLRALEDLDAGSKRGGKRKRGDDEDEESGAESDSSLESATVLVAKSPLPKHPKAPPAVAVPPLPYPKAHLPHTARLGRIGRGGRVILNRRLLHGGARGVALASLFHPASLPQPNPLPTPSPSPSPLAQALRDGPPPTHPVVPLRQAALLLAGRFPFPCAGVPAAGQARPPPPLRSPNP